MHLSTTTPNPPQCSFDASKIPSLSMVGPCHLPTPQSQPQSSNNVQSFAIASSPSCPPLYAPQTLPPFSTSFQAAFPSSAAQPHQPIPHINAWNPTSVTIFPNVSSPTHLNPSTESPFRLPLVTNIPVSQYEHSQSPSVNPTLPPFSAPVTKAPTPPLYPTHVCSAHDKVLVRLPAVSPNVPAHVFPLVTLPGTSNAYTTHALPGETPAAAPQTTNVPHTTAAPSRKPRTKRKKHAPAAKRSRTKTPAAAAIKEPSNAAVAATTSAPLPPMGGHHKGTSLPPSRKSRGQTSNKGASQTESIPSPAVPVNRNMTLTASKPPQPTRGLNFADVVLEKPSYRAESTRYRYESSREGLKAREANKPPIGDSVHTQLATRTSVHAASQSSSAAGGASVPNSMGGKGAGSIAKANSKTKEFSSSLPTMAGPHESEKLPGEVEMSPTDGRQGTSSFGSDYYGVSNSISGLNGGVGAGKINAGIPGIGGNSVTHGLETSRMAASAGRRPYNEEREENAAESLMTLAGTLVPTEFNCRQEQDKGGKDVHSGGAWKVHADDSNMEREKESTKNSKSKKGASLKGVGSLQNCKHRGDRGDSGIQVNSNLANFFVREWHLQSNASQSYSPTIPGHSPSSVNNTPRPAPRQSPGVSIPCQQRQLVYVQGTPVDIRETPNLFTRPPTSSLPHVSRNRSLTQETPVLGQCLTTPQEAREKAIHHQSTPDTCTNLHRPAEIVRPLFQEGTVVQPTPNLQQHLPASHHHENQFEIYRPMHQAATLTQTAQQLFPPPASSDLPAPQRQTQSAAIVLSQPSLSRESLPVPDTAHETESMPQTTKRRTKQRTPRNPSKVTKPAKATSVRSSAKNPKPRRPRQPKRASTAQPRATNSVPSRHATPTTTAPLRLRASFSTNGAAEPPITGSVPSSGSVLHRQTEQEMRSTEAQVTVNSFHHLPSLPGVHRAATSSVAGKPSHPPNRDSAPIISKRTKSSNPRTRKTPVNKTSASIEKAAKLADKALRSRQNSMLYRTREPTVNTLPSNQPPQIVKLQPPAPQEPLHPQAHDEVRLGYSSTAQPQSSQQACDMRPRVDGGSPTFNAAPENPALVGSLSTKEAQVGSALAHNLCVSSGTTRGHDASSPRTESTQQTSPPDTASGGPSETEHLFDSDDVTLAHTKSHVPTSSRSAAPNASVKSVLPKRIQQSESRKTSQLRSPSVPSGTEVDTAVDNTGYPSSLLPRVESSPAGSRKRQHNAKSIEANKRRKKNAASNPEQTSSQRANGVLPCKEDAIHVVVDGQQEGPLGPNKTTSPKKSAVRVQPKNKGTRHPTPVRKRPSSSTKTQTKEASKRNGTTNLRLCLSVREKVERPTSAPETKRSGDSCGSPVTPDKVRNGFRYASKSPQKAGSRVRKNSQETGKNCGDKKTQSTPCFAEELKNLRVSGFLKTGEGVSSPSFPEDPPCGVPGLQKSFCVLCQKQSHNEMVKHPCFPVRAFNICKACSEIVSKRVEEHGAKRKTVAVPSEEALAQRTTLFVMLIEEMVRHFAPSDHEHRDIKGIYDFIMNRSFREMAQRAETLSVNLDMLTVLRVTLRKVGFTIRGGKLRWPAADFTLPSLADTRALVSHALPARIEDLRKGILPGEAAWNETFGKDQDLARQGSSCVMYEKVFGLIGLSVVHVADCNTEDSSTDSCKVKFDAVSMGALMYRTAAMLSGTVTRELLAASWTKEEAFRFINETEMRLCNGSYEGTLEPCCICGVPENPQKESSSFRFSKCTVCSKPFCSICLLNVLGTSEYLRSFGDGGYICMLCRFQKNAELCPSGKSSRGEHDRRLRLHNITGIKKRSSERRVHSIPPLLLLSPTMRADILFRLQSCNNMRKAHGIAKFCEVANDNSIRSAMGLQGGQAFHDVCLECKLPATREEQAGSEDEMLICGHESCINVMHKTCLAPQRQARRRGSRSKWSCPHHQCSKCDQRDDLKLLRCRTCPTTFCKDHIPSPSEVYLFSERTFACSTCRSFLRAPQLLRLKPQASKSERKRNQFAQALVIDQRKRSAVVRKLSEGPGCCQGASSSFREFRRELETK